MKRAQSLSMIKEPFCIRRQQGFSLVEAILATAVFGLLVTALVGAYLYGEESTALAGARLRAGMLADEGLEALRSMRDADYANIPDTPGSGLATTSNKWNLSGPQDVTDIFTRGVSITSLDSARKEIIATTTWQQNAQRRGTTTLVSRLTNWARYVGQNLVVYPDGTTLPKYRTYDETNDTFAGEQNTVTGSAGRTFQLRTSPTTGEAIAGYVTVGGVLQVMCFDGKTWINEWSATVGGTATTRRFDIAYETNTGDAIVLYSANVPTTNELLYRTKLGSTKCGSANWSGATNLNPIRTTGTVHWVKMAWDRHATSTLITAIWADSNADLSAMVWSGSAWGNEPSAVTEASLEVVAAAQDIDDFDVEYESISGDVMVAWANSAGANGTNGARYRVCTGGTATCTWGAVTTPPTFNDDATNLDISANPNTDEIVFASIGNAGSDLQIGRWSGTAWSNNANTDVSCTAPVAGSKLVSTGWLASGQIPLGFAFDYGGRNFTEVRVSSNGMLQFQAVDNDPNNSALALTGAGGEPNIDFAMLPFWDDLDPLGNPNVLHYETRGAAPNRVFIVSYDAVNFFGSANTATFQVQIYEQGHFVYRYGNTTGNSGANATIGYEVGNTNFVQYSLNTASVPDGSAILWTPTGGSPSFSFDDSVATENAYPWIDISATGNTITLTDDEVSAIVARSVIVYNDVAATNVGWYLGNAGTFTVQGDFNPTPAFNVLQRWYDIQMDPLHQDELLFLVSSSAGSLFAKQLLMTSPAPAFVWSNSDGGAALETALSQLITSPFAFAYKRNE